MASSGQRRGDETKAEIQQVALDLFSEQGYEATSLREIAERLGITKAALYYHFKNKEDIVRSLLRYHLEALDELIDWASGRPATPELRREVVERWMGLFRTNGLQMARFMIANHSVVRDLHPGRENLAERIEALFSAITESDAPPERRLRIRMAVLSLNFAFLAGRGLELGDEQVLAVARDAADRLLEHDEAPVAVPTT
ncbi:TetR/AcrR family transcriptional regulator [Streptomyces sp. TP-A0874]|uniref:TetR/AcrR family transcriptional regulator n=1 Tax=Streptomyces sp. TP-A0874 TaxID=549819 RepID=UPI00085366C1|nr:TetR/AcrR family transcriptional regulator [Streptomyces sp. TP-A0874]